MREEENATRWHLSVPIKASPCPTHTRLSMSHLYWDKKLPSKNTLLHPSPVLPPLIFPKLCGKEEGKKMVLLATSHQ